MSEEFLMKWQLRPIEKEVIQFSLPRLSLQMFLTNLWLEWEHIFALVLLFFMVLGF